MKTKYFIKITGLALLTVLLSFTSCEKQEVIKVVGFVQGYVYDANTNEVLDNVTIRWELPGGVADSTVATAADGFNIDNLPSGNYILKCSKANYATSTIEVEIPKDDIAVTIKGGGSKEYVLDVIPKLYSLGANVTGRIYKYEDVLFFGLSSPAGGAVVKLQYPFGNFVPNVYEATTDEQGYYTFENVPAAPGNIMITDYKNGNLSYFPSSNNINFAGSSGLVSTIQPLYLFPYENWDYGGDRLSLIDCNALIAPGVGTNNFPLSGNIELEFSREINEDVTYALFDIVGNYIWLYDQSYNSISFTATFSGNKLIIDPDLDLNADEYYYFTVVVCGERMHDYYFSTLYYNPILFKTAP